MSSNKKVISDHGALLLLLDVARGLSFMHAQDPVILHRDVKQVRQCLAWVASPFLCAAHFSSAFHQLWT